MKARITLEVDVPAGFDLATLIRVALHDFCIARDAVSHVRDRYPGLSGVAYQKKLAEVALQSTIARNLALSASRAPIENLAEVGRDDAWFARHEARHAVREACDRFPDLVEWKNSLEVAILREAGDAIEDLAKEIFDQSVGEIERVEEASRWYRALMALAAYMPSQRAAIRARAGG